LRPDIVVVQMGMNDLTGLHSGSREVDWVTSTTRDAIRALVGSAGALGAQIIVTTIFPLARGLTPNQAMQMAIRTLNNDLLALASEGVQLLDSATLLAGPDGYVLPAYADDELHLSPAGYATLN
jgi:lysophospholipase L1-like esterase